MILYQLARAANRRIKAAKKQAAGRYISPVRRIEQVSPPKQKMCAMTFDDGPSALVPDPDVSGGIGLTMHLSEQLHSRGFSATFDIIGDTSENYPDERGQIGSFYWGGKRFDHYPDFEMDSMGGAKAQPELIRHLAERGFELANHSYRHLIFGKNTVYKQRAIFENLEQVEHDLRRLHELVHSTCGVSMTLSRPPHYINNIAGGFSAYDAYELLGYNYMAASFDGMGWMPQKADYQADVTAMVNAVKNALESDPDCLSGQIIFQKDGCNMSRFTPIASALGGQLDLLERHGYRVVSVSELLSHSPFEDLAVDAEGFEAARAMTAAGYALGFKNNSFYPQRSMTFGQLCMSICPKERRIERISARREGRAKIGKFAVSNPYCGALAWASSVGLNYDEKQAVNGKILEAVAEIVGAKRPSIKVITPNRAQVVQALADCML